MSRGFVVKGGGGAYEQVYFDPNRSGFGIYHGTNTPAEVQTASFTIDAPFPPRACLFAYTPTFTFQTFEGATYFKNAPSAPYVPDSGEIISLNLSGLSGYSQVIHNISYSIVESKVKVEITYSRRGNTQVGSRYAYFYLNTIIVG